MEWPLSAVASCLHAQITRKRMRVGPLEHGFSARRSALCEVLEPAREKLEAVTEVLKRPAKHPGVRGEDGAAEQHGHRTDERDRHRQRHDECSRDQKQPAQAKE